MITVFYRTFFRAGAGAQVRKQLEPEPKINSLGSATLEKSLGALLMAGDIFPEIYLLSFPPVSLPKYTENVLGRLFLASSQYKPVRRI